MDFYPSIIAFYMFMGVLYFRKGFAEEIALGKHPVKRIGSDPECEDPV